MFRLIITVKRGSACTLPGAARSYPSIEAARAAAAAVLREDRVQRVMIVRDLLPPAFVEWTER